MNKITEINVFTFGDAFLPKTWSNVPYLLTKTLENKGYKVNRINIAANRYLQFMYNRFVYPLTNIVWKDNVYLYERTFINQFFTFYRIKRHSRKFPNADLNIFTNFSFYNKYSDKPNVLLCDWDLDIGIRERIKRRPFYFELQSINRQKKVIEKADLVVSLFPKSAELMRNKYKNPNIFHLSQNVINSLYNKPFIEDDIIQKKLKSHDLLFVGSENYIEGAKLLIKVQQNLKLKYPNLRVKIIGIKKDMFKSNLKGVDCFGYLDKNDPIQNNVYYDLMINSRIFVNPTPIWGGYSSTIEAMYFYNPVIIAPYEEFVTEFGEDVSFGKYCKVFSENYLEASILEILEDNRYSCICKNAHAAVRNYTWDNYIDLLMNKIIEIDKDEQY